MATPKKIIIQDLELADKEIARLRKENKDLNKYIKALEIAMKNKEALNETYRKQIDKLKQYEAMYKVRS